MRRKTLAVLCSLAAVAGMATPASAQEQPVAHFVVLGREGKPLDRVEAAVVSAGGQVLKSWPQISVVVAVSQDADFAEEVRGRPGVEAAGATQNLAELNGQPAVQQFEGPMAPVTHGAEEPLAPYQWAARAEASTAPAW